MKHTLIEELTIDWKVYVSIGVIGLIATIALFLVPEDKSYEECSSQEGEAYRLCNELYMKKHARETANHNRDEAYEREVKPFDDLKLIIREQANTTREKLFAMDVSYTTGQAVVEDFIQWSQDNEGIPYKLWGKSMEAIDCSGLFTVYGEQAGIVSKAYKIHLWNAYNLFTKKTAPVETLKRWDVIYFDAQGDYANHIATVTRVMYEFPGEKGLEIVDASLEFGVSTRYITISQDTNGKWVYPIEEDGSSFRFELHFATNPLLSFEREEALQSPTPKNNYNPTWYGEKDWFYLSHYNVGDPRQNDESPCIWAGGANICEHLENGGKSIALVAPYRSKYGIWWWDKVVLEGDEACSWTYTVLDEMNKRFRDKCIVWSSSKECIRGDIAYPYGEKWLGGNCYIKEVIKAE